MDIPSRQPTLLTRRGSGRALQVLAGCAWLLASLACGVSPIVAPRPTPTTAIIPIVVRTNGASTPSGASSYQLTVSASCAPGEQMIGGGFGTGNVFEFAAFVAASYPASANTWTVSAGSISAFSASAEVYCVPASPPLAIQIARSTGDQSDSVACTGGSVLLSGGFRATGNPSSGAEAAVQLSYPAGNAWHAVGGAGTQQVYALCAASHAQPGTVARATFNPHSTTNGENPAGGSAQCPASQVAPGGGFDGASLVLASEAAGAAFSGWAVEAGGDSAVSVYANCVHLIP